LSDTNKLVQPAYVAAFARLIGVTGHHRRWSDQSPATRPPPEDEEKNGGKKR
jgi:hypothetical protein